MNKTRVFRLIACCDLLMTLPFAVPGLAGLVVSLLNRLHGLFGTSIPFPEFGPLHLFFVNLFGIMGVLWALVRIYRPEPWLAAFDAVGRVVVGGLMVGCWLAGGTPLTALFSVSEWVGAVAAALCLLRSPRNLISKQ